MADYRDRDYYAVSKGIDQTHPAIVEQLRSLANPIGEAAVKERQEEMMEALSWAKEQAVLAMNYPRAAALRDVMVLLRANFRGPVVPQNGGGE